ncbi:uncharacterized protein LOC141892954 isoform X1 [Acropora palmata]|uniref:uncharacterized protein LOC141892954 isoform X1 n=1 Tax=Acropora palmata TaxID=6131 RepID=UPI003DA04BC0
MAAERFQTRTDEEEIEQLLHDKRSKSANKAADNAVRTLRDFCKDQNLDESFQELSKADLNSLLRKFCNKVCVNLGRREDFAANEEQREPQEFLKMKATGSRRCCKGKQDTGKA